jgi:hypothetical protein
VTTTIHAWPAARGDDGPHGREPPNGIVVGRWHGDRGTATASQTGYRSHVPRATHPRSCDLEELAAEERTCDDTVKRIRRYQFRRGRLSPWPFGSHLLQPGAYSEAWQQAWK